MNELGRQRYLTAMGIESYIPRLLLSNIPAPFLCEASVVNDVMISPKMTPSNGIVGDIRVINAPLNNGPPIQIINTDSPADRNVGVQAVEDVLKSMGMQGPVQAFPEQSLEDKVVESGNKAGVSSKFSIEPFVLTVWRPREDLLIIDAHHKGEAYPTHTLLLNILKYLWSKDTLLADGDRVTFPLISNMRGGITNGHMRDSLQTWFTAEYEKRPCPHVWLMGENATQYLLPPNEHYTNLLWQETTLVLDETIKPSFTAKILPSLTDFLTAPALKEKLWHVLKISNVRIR